MKKTFTSFFSAKNSALLFLFGLPMLSTAQVLFTQNFNSSTVLTDYWNASPTEHQFDFIGIAGTTSTSAGSSVNNASSLNKLRAYRFAGVYAFARTTDFVQNATPSVLKIKFKINVISHTATTTSPGGGSFSVGSGFAASATAEDTLVTVHSRLAFGFVGNSTPNFFLRTGIINSATYNGEQDVSWYINNSGASINYTNPDGVGSTSLANDKADIWVGTTRIFSDISASVPAQNLTDFKFTFNNSGGTITVDDIEISTGSNVVIPITLSSFAAKKTGAANQLTWTTATEINNNGYHVERQSGNGTWASLDFVKGNNKASTYIFEDKDPLSISYYRLRQVDFDGKESLSKVVSVNQIRKGSIGIFPNPTSDKVNITLSDNDRLESTMVAVYNLIGKQVLVQKTTANTLELDMSSLAKGTYLLKIDTNNSTYTKKIIKQ